MTLLILGGLLVCNAFLAAIFYAVILRAPQGEETERGLVVRERDK